MSAHVLVIHGPNLGHLGLREPERYGRQTLAELNADLVTLGESLGVKVSCFQSDYEGALVERIGQSRSDGTSAIIINAAAYTHTSIAIRDALLFCEKPAIEVHLSNVHARESFRHHSYLADICLGVICGLGADSYRMALRALASRLA